MYRTMVIPPSSLLGVLLLLLLLLLLLDGLLPTEAWTSQSVAHCRIPQQRQRHSSSTRLWEQRSDASSSSSSSLSEINNNSNTTTTTLLSPSTTTATTTRTTTSKQDAQFGDVVSLKPKTSSSSSSSEDSSPFFSAPSSSSSDTSTTISPASFMKRRNFGVAVLSMGLAVFNYFWQYTHPLAPIQLLYQMEQQSSPISVIGTTNKPTVVDFWAPWCENCKLLAPTLLQIEQEYGKDVNFVMINGDNDAAWPLIEAFGVDAIPHLALVEADGTVDTALIGGPIPKEWLEQDLQVLVENAKILSSSPVSVSSSLLKNSDGEAAQSTTASNKPSLRPLPYQMMDAFANRPDEQRRIQVYSKSTSSSTSTSSNSMLLLLLPNNNNDDDDE